MTSKQWVCVCSSQLQYSLFDYPKVCFFFFTVATWTFGFHVDFHFDPLEFMADYGWLCMRHFQIHEHEASKRHEKSIYNTKHTVHSIHLRTHLQCIYIYYILKLGLPLPHQEDHTWGSQPEPSISGRMWLGIYRGSSKDSMQLPMTYVRNGRKL